MIVDGKKLKKYRLEKELTQKQLGEMIGVSRECISGWEQEKKLPYKDDLKKLASVFDVSINDLVEEDIGYNFEKYKRENGYNNWIFIAEYSNHILFYNKKGKYRESFIKKNNYAEEPYAK